MDPIAVAVTVERALKTAVAQERDVLGVRRVHSAARRRTPEPAAEVVDVSRRGRSGCVQLTTKWDDDLGFLFSPALAAYETVGEGCALCSGLRSASDDGVPWPPALTLRR